MNKVVTEKTMYLTKKNTFLLIALILLGLFIIGIIDRVMIYNDYYGDVIQEKITQSKSVKIGMGVKFITAKENSQKILKVMDVIPGSPAMKAGIEKGDIIQHINGKIISSEQELIKMFNNLRSGKEISLNIRRAKQNNSISIKIN